MPLFDMTYKRLPVAQSTDTFVSVFLPIIKGQPRGCPFRVRIRILLIYA